MLFIKELQLFSPGEKLTLVEAFSATSFMSAVWCMKWLWDCVHKKFKQLTASAVDGSWFLFPTHKIESS